MNNAGSYNVNNGGNNRSIGEVLNEVKIEAKEFVQTRIDMLKVEMKEKLSAWKTAAPLLGVAALLGITGFWVLTVTLIALIAQAFIPNTWAYFWSTLIVGGVYVILAGGLGALAWGEIKARKSLAPVRTMEVLKQDQEWIQSETRKAA